MTNTQNTQSAAQLLSDQADLANRIVVAREAIRSAERHLAELEQQADDLDRLVKAAEARESAAALPVGTRVHHHHWADIVGTVVEGRGDGVAVLQDGQDAPSYGFHAREWVAV